MDAVERLGYDWEYDGDFVPQLTFAADGVRAEYEDAQPVTVIRPAGREATTAATEYTIPGLNTTKRISCITVSRTGKRRSTSGRENSLRSPT